jgi:integrase
MNSWTGTAQSLGSRSTGLLLRYRIHLEGRRLAPGTVNLRLGAVRRLAYEAADCGLLRPDLAAGIRRVKGVKKIGVRFGNWLTAEQSQRLWQAPGGERLKEKRDRALLAVLLACGLRRHEAVELSFGHIQQREEHWAIVDLKGKAGHIRTIPVPTWVKNILDQWAPGSEHYIGQVVSSCAQNGKNLGREADGKGCMARGSGVCRQSRYREVSAARPSPLCRIRDHAESRF